MIYKGDCLEIMKTIKDHTIDMVLCDLPYGTTACKWDVIIPFDELWKEYNRLIKDDGAIVLFSKEPFTSLLITSNIQMFKYRWNWLKDTKSNFMQANYQPLNNAEDICVFSKGYAREIKDKTKMKYFPQFTIGEEYKIPKKSTGSGIFQINNSKSKYEHKDRDTTKRYPFITLDFKTDKDHFHPTQKPIALLEYLLKTYTNEGDLVLDNCMGSGSTGVACKNINRKFIGIEKDEKYFNIAKERIENKIEIDGFFE